MQQVAQPLPELVPAKQVEHDEEPSLEAKVPAAHSAQGPPAELVDPTGQLIQSVEPSKLYLPASQFKQASLLAYWFARQSTPRAIGSQINHDTNISEKEGKF